MTSPIEQALRELVALKKLRDELDKTAPGNWSNEQAAQSQDYYRRKPLAWAAALSALEAPQPLGEREAFERWWNRTDPANAWDGFAAWAAWQARVSLGVSEAAPAGWKLVPVEPPNEMLRAAVKAREGSAVYKIMSDGGLNTLEREAADVWDAMLAAVSTAATRLPEMGEGDWPALPEPFGICDDPITGRGLYYTAQHIKDAMVAAVEKYKALVRGKA